MTKLNPCPVCGGEAELDVSKINLGYVAQCKNCIMRTPEFTDGLKANLWWNQLGSAKKERETKTLRDEIAMAVLIPVYNSWEWHIGHDEAAREAYEIADSMLKERNK